MTAHHNAIHGLCTMFVLSEGTPGLEHNVLHAHSEYAGCQCQATIVLVTARQIRASAHAIERH